MEAINSVKTQQLKIAMRAKKHYAGLAWSDNVTKMLISYAQNFEDVILWRALKHVVDGFYVDVGANDPNMDSVSRLFYQNGWRGVHIEPIREFAERIRLARPDEEVIEAAVGSQRKSLTIFKVGDTGMSTGDATIAAQHEAAGFQIESRTVPCIALSKILAPFENREIHWLKIDVEGMEKSAIDSWLPSKARPWIVVVESTEPNSPTPNFAKWEPGLLKLGYEFVYFDGLNRFYVSTAQPQLKEAFGPGPNYFDNFSLTRASVFTRLQAEEQRNSDQVNSQLRQELDESRANHERQVEANRVSLDLQDRKIGELVGKLALQEQILAQGQLSISLRDSTISSRDLTIGDLNSKLASQEKLVAEVHLAVRERDNIISSRDLTIGDLNSKLTSQEKLVAEVHLAVRERDNIIAELAGTIRNLTDELASKEKILEFRIDELLESTSWRLTRPMRGIRSGAAYLGHGGWAWLRFAPRSRPRRVARKAVALMSRSAILWAIARVVFKGAPTLKHRLRIAINNDPALVTNFGEPSQSNLPTPSKQETAHERLALEPVILDAKEPRTLLFVGHTVTCPTNTGVQRTVRGLASGLVGNGVNLRYVKWDATSKQCVLINSEEREHLSRWNGPKLVDQEKSLYLSHQQSAAAVQVHSARDKFIVPEVVHASFQDHLVAVDLIMWAREHEIEVGFIFYDAIPLLRKEFASMAPAHAQYMQHLRLADVVWSISRRSGRDLISFWYASERADLNTIPSVLPLHLPAGSASVDRAIGVRVPENLILSVGTIEQRKNQLQLIRAFQAHKDSEPESPWKLVLVGNLHPDVAADVQGAITRNSSISHLGHVSDEELEALYSACAFTVFPSIEEGFGLPILESLAHGKPCICANFGAMAELIDGGGCLAVDTRDLASVRGAIEELMKNLPLRQSLMEAACSRRMISWNDYAASITELIDTGRRLRSKLGSIYYWVDLTASFPNNTGIQRFTRQLARELMAMGLHLIPVKWDQRTGFCAIEKNELSFLAGWDGPSVEQWSAWVNPEDAGQGSWLVMPELPLNLTRDQQVGLRRYASERGLKQAALFYAANPAQTRQDLPQHFLRAHREYMAELAEYDLVLAISNASWADLIKFLGRDLIKPQSLETQIELIALPEKSCEDGKTSDAWRAYAEEFAKRLACHSNFDRGGELLVSDDDVRQRSVEMNIPPRPKLSLCISTYNRAEWLAINLKNWARLYPKQMSDVELCVCDNASTDHTEEVVKPYLVRSDFSYLRNPKNVGMLGNLRVTANHARGDYIWIIGDDDLLMPKSIERVLEAIDDNPDASLVYLNYAFTRIEDARVVTDFEKFFAEATPIVPAEPDRVGRIKEICARNENFFTAIYTLVLRRDHAVNAYSQNTNGRPFSTMLTAIPTTHYVLHNMMNELGVWIGSPQIVVNMNVSWMKYAPLWILERVPELYEVAERKGVACEDIDRWRRHTLPGIFHYFCEIYHTDPLNNAAFFSAARLVRRFKHLPEFSLRQGELVSVYEKAHQAGHPAATEPVSEIFPDVSG